MMFWKRSIIVAIGALALLSTGPAEASIFKRLGHAVASVGRKVYKVGDKINKGAGKVVGNVASKALDTTGSVLDRIPVANSVGTVFHDAGKAVKSTAAHYGAIGAAGAAVVGVIPGTIGQAAVAGGMGGYYGRQVYLAGRCAPKETAACKRLEAKP